MKRVLLSLLLFALTFTVNAQINDVRSILARRNAEAGRTNDARDTAPTPDDCGDVREALDEGGTPAPATKLPLSMFGVGIGGVSSLGDDRIESAELVDDRIVVTADDDVSLGAIMEAHALIFTREHLWAVHDEKGRLYVTSEKPCEAAGKFPTIAHGPFAALQVSGDDIIGGLGVGWMMGFRMKQSDSSLNIGLAYMLQDDVKTLANGFREGQTLKDGQEIQYRTGRGSAIALVISFGF